MFELNQETGLNCRCSKWKKIHCPYVGIALASVYVLLLFECNQTALEENRNLLLIAPDRSRINFSNTQPLKLAELIYIRNPTLNPPLSASNLPKTHLPFVPQAAGPIPARGPARRPQGRSFRTPSVVFKGSLLVKMSKLSCKTSRTRQDSSRNRNRICHQCFDGLIIMPDPKKSSKNHV